MKRILMILDSEFPPDVRVENEIESLKNEGFEVAIAVYSFLKKPKDEFYNEYKIYRKKVPRIIYKSSAAILILPLYFNFWKRYIKTILKKERYDVIHIHDLPLSKIGYKIARKYKMKLVCDQHEYYSNWIVRTKHYNTFIGKIIKVLSCWNKYEKKYLQKADLVVTVEDSLKQIYVSNIGIPQNKIVSLPNTPRGNIFHIDNINTDIIKKYEKDFVLFYAGGLDHLRGIEFVIEAVSQLINNIPEIKFLIAGKESKAFKLENIITRFNVENFVDFIGWVPVEKLPFYIAASKVCIHVPKSDSLETNNTIGTKVYQYAAMGKPVIVSDAKMMKTFVESNNIGFSVGYGDVAGLCDIVKRLHDNLSLVESIKLNSISVASCYTWESTSKQFLYLYKKLSTQQIKDI